MKLERQESDNNVSSKFRIIDLSSGIAIPQFIETGYSEWIRCGEDNLFPQFLVDTYHLKSITNKTIINRKAKMIGGNGFKAPIDPKLQLFINNIFNRDNLDDILYKLSYDLEIHNGFALNVIWGKNGEIAEIGHIPFETVRIDKNNSVDGPNFYWISGGWDNIRKFKPTRHPEFSFKYKAEKSQILYVTEFQPGSRMFYPIPVYYSSINWIIAEWEISNFHRASIENGFSAGFLLNFATGVPSPEEMEAAEREIRSRYTGSWNSGKFILTFSNGKDEEPKLEPIPLADTDSRYTELNDMIKANIFTANEVVNPELFGVSVPGKLGGKQELIEGLEIFQAVYIGYKQRFIENVFNKLIKYNGIQEKLIINKYIINEDIVEPAVPPVE